MATRLMTPRLLLRQSFAGRGRVLAVGIALLMLGRAASLALPVTARDLIDRLRTDDATTLIAVLTLAVLTAALIQAVASYVSTRLVAVGAQRAIADLRIRLHRHALALPVRAFNETTVGSLSTRILSDVDALRQLMGSGLLQLLGAAFTALLALLALFWIHWQLTLAILAVFLAAGAVMAFLFGRARPLARARSQTLAAISGRLTESLSTIRVIKAYAAEPLVQAAFAARAVSLFEETRKSLHVAGLMSVLTVLAVAALTITTLQVGGRSLLAGEMTIGDLVAYFVLVGLLAGPIVTLANQGPEISTAQAALERIATFLAQDTEPTSHPDSPLPRLRGDIEFQDLDFAYPSGPPVLRGLSQRIQAGSTVAISGASGAGKSSLFSLLMGLEQPTGGCILIDGRPLTELPLAAYRAQLGAVLQDDGLFDGSIRDNVLLGRPDASEDEVRNACHLAHVMEFADRLPQRLETPVGERGVCLSGGQRQRIAIARAILRDPAILLLDEATAHLDQRSAAYVQAGLAALMRGRTTLIIAHQPSTIGRADRHLVLADGRLRPACASEPRAACA